MKLKIDNFLKICITISALTLFFGTLIVPTALFYPLYNQTKSCSKKDLNISLTKDEKILNSYKLNDNCIIAVTNKKLILIDICNNQIKKNIIFENFNSNTNIDMVKQ